METQTPAFARTGWPLPPDETPRGPWASVYNLMRNVFGRVDAVQARLDKLEETHRAEIVAMNSRIDCLFAASRQ